MRFTTCSRPLRLVALWKSPSDRSERLTDNAFIVRAVQSIQQVQIVHNGNDLDAAALRDNRTNVILSVSEESRFPRVYEDAILRLLLTMSCE